MQASKLSRVARRIGRALGREGGDAQAQVQAQAQAQAFRDDVSLIERSGLFDRAYYLEKYADVLPSGVDPVEHYVTIGAREGWNPSPLFDTTYYLALHPDVAASSVNPFRHYCEFGRAEGRSASAFDPAMDARALDSLGDAYGIIAASGLFDREYYCQTCPEAAAPGVDPIRHYVREGCDAGLNPNPWFDSKSYLTNSPDVAQAGMNPLAHFAQYGWNELRSVGTNAYDLVWHWVFDGNEGAQQANPMVAHVATLHAGGEPDVRRLGAMNAQEMTRFADAVHGLLADRELSETQLVVIGRYAMEHKAWAAAEEAYHALVLKCPEVLGYKLLLAEVIEKQGRLWQLIDVLEEAVAQAPQNADLLFRLGDANERMNRYPQAVAAFAQATELSPTNSLWHYRHGYALDRAGRSHAARLAYAMSIKRDRKHDATRFGIGVLHQQRGLWKEAAIAYGAATSLRPADADLWYKYGFAQDRCYDWQGATQAYRIALSLDFKRAYWHYRLGFVLERQGRWREAAGAYRVAADMDVEHRVYWFYRCGYVFEQAGQFMDACIAYMMTNKGCRDAFRKNGANVYRDWLPAAEQEAPSNDAGEEIPIEAESAFQAGTSEALREYIQGFGEGAARLGTYVRAEHYLASAKLLESHGRLDDALQAYTKAIERSPNHVPAWYFALGRLLTKLGRYAEACASFRQSRILKRPYGVDMSKYEASKETKALMEYNEYFHELPIQRNVVLYESFLGASVGCNPFAIFRYILDRPEFQGWTHVWVIHNWSDIPAEFADRSNVIFIPRNCDAYRRYLASAEYLINNVTFPYWFSRRDGQKYLNTWHGTPLKGLGKDMKGEFMAHGNVTRNFLHATHLLSPNRHTSDVMMERYDVNGIYSGKFAETGYPRVDHVVRSDADSQQRLFSRLGLKPGKPVVLYAPTWRGVQGKPETDAARIAADVASMTGDDYQLVFRGHHFMESALAGHDMSVVIAPQSLDTCDLLSIVDVLVTDYSSILFDYLPAGKPIVYYAYDLEEYAEGRGFYFDMSELPGTLCRSVDAVREAITAGIGTDVRLDPGYQDAVRRFSPKEDGNASRRAAEFLFNESVESVVDRYDDTRRSIVMYNGMFPANGITSSYLNLLRSLTGADVQITTLIEPAKIKVDPVRVHKFAAIPQEVKCVVRDGRMVMDPEQIWITSRMESKKRLESDEMRDVFWSAFKSEYLRIFGGMKHEAFVNFEGYSALVCSIGAAAPADVQKSIYLHNDMIGERDVRLPYLDRVFGTYPRYDHLISVSRTMSEVNKEKLGEELGLSGDAFTSCDNTIDIEGMMGSALEPLEEDLKPWFGHGTTFMTSGRMSPEKDHAKLFRAFSGVLEEFPDARLVLLGDGPLRQDLQLQLEELGISDRVMLAGLRMNPFPSLRAADCFVLSSNHEGQPMVLLEAMTLGKPIVATDINGNRGVLGDDYGQLVDNSEDGLREGMLNFLRRGGRPYCFSAPSYQKEAVENFVRVVLAA